MENQELDALLAELSAQLRELGIPLGKHIAPQVEVNTRAQRRLGCCVCREGRFTIQVSARLLEDAPLLRATLLHELLHTCPGCLNHGPAWKSYAKTVGEALGLSITRAVELEGDAAPDLLIVDSVQTLTSESADGLPGNVSQVRAVATEIVDACKRGVTTAVLVGHVTKDGALAGPRLLEHMVDTVISLEGDRRQMFRLLRVLKNRFGPNQELLVFQMVRQGLEVVEDPATYFLGARDASRGHGR